MSIVIQSHGGTRRDDGPLRRREVVTESLVPAQSDTAVDEAADFGFLFPPSGNPSDYLPNDSLAELDELGTRMIPNVPNPPLPQTGNPLVTTDSALPPVLTYWGQFLDHELTARTDRETAISNIGIGLPSRGAAEIESQLKNARSPRFDLDSVYGGLPVGVEATPDVVTVISGMRHPGFPAKMRVGTAHSQGPLPDELDPHRDLPRFSQVEQSVRDAYLRLARARLSPEDFTDFEAQLPGRAIIGDMRNDENLIVAQFHLSFLRFHNRVVDFLAENNTGWIADFHSAKTLTRLHYQRLIVDGYLKSICQSNVLQNVLDTKARDFFRFRADYATRNTTNGLGNVLPLEFSVAAFRFGHTMVRNTYDFNRNFGRPGTGILGDAPFEQLFTFTGGGGFRGAPRVPENWIIDWSRFVTADPDTSDGVAARVARSLDTELAPPLATMVNEGGDQPTPDLAELFRHLARRNLRRGLSLRLPTGQALHAHLRSIGAVSSGPVVNVGNLLSNKPELVSFLENSSSRLHERTPLWFYCLAEAESTGGNHLGEVGSWLVASTFIGTLLSDPESALSLDFGPGDSPLRLPNGSQINNIEDWMKFALVME